MFIIFQLSESFSEDIFLFKSKFFGVLLIVPTKVVIDSYLSSSRALPLRTEILASHTSIFTWDVFLRSLLSCLPEWPFTSKSVLRHQPKRCFTSGYHCWSRHPHSIPCGFFSFGWAPAISKMTFTGFQCCNHNKPVSWGSVRTSFVLYLFKKCYKM